MGVPSVAARCEIRAGVSRSVERPAIRGVRIVAATGVLTVRPLQFGRGGEVHAGGREESRTNRERKPCPLEGATKTASHCRQGTPSQDGMTGSDSRDMRLTLVSWPFTRRSGRSKIAGLILTNYPRRIVRTVSKPAASSTEMAVPMYVACVARTSVEPIRIDQPTFWFVTIHGDARYAIQRHDVNHVSCRADRSSDGWLQNHRDRKRIARCRPSGRRCHTRCGQRRPSHD